MPSFQHLLVLSVLALSLSVQSAPVKTVETRGLRHVSRFAEPAIVPFDDVEAREFDDDEDDTLEARETKHHQAHRKEEKKGHGKGKGKRSSESDDEDDTLEARETKHHQAHRKEEKKGHGKGKGKRSLADIDE